VSADLVIEPIDLPHVSSQWARRRRLQVAGAIGRHIVPTVRTRRRMDVARSVRRTFDQLGATFTKFGQLVGSAGSLFGEDVAAEFRACLDQGPPVPYPNVRVAVEAELDRPLHEVFATFDERPIAAASIAVVHRATLLDGQQVAVKILRPHIEDIIATDMAVMAPIADFLGRQVAVGIAGVLPGLIDGLTQQLREELDLRNEARALDWFRGVVATMDLPRMRVPEPVHAASGRRVLTMEYLDGVPVDDAAAIEALGIDPKPLVIEALKGFFGTTLCLGTFHGDIHAGNLMVTTDGCLGVVDWGIVGRLDPETHRFIRRAVQGVLGDDTAWAEVHTHLKGIYGGNAQDLFGFTDQQMQDFIKSQMLMLFTRPFGEVDVKMLMADIPDVDGRQTDNSLLAKLRRWQDQRRFQQRMLDSDGMGSDFDRSTFLLGKQLAYFERYGKMYTPDVPLLWDRAVFEQLLAGSAVPAA
jgi:predicted unusual protein kinase regulating ubiquinone biosynthesis (AarF/ABC1/UbiB family)